MIKFSQTILTEPTLIEATIYQKVANCQKAPVFYLHGGGLVFGQREDLPLPYLEKLTNAGHPVIALDYLLAPEVKLKQIFSLLKTTIQAIIEQLPTWGFQTDYYLMGRSAGSFLCYLLIKEGFTPKGLISFYGYYSLTAPEFRQPNPNYLKFPRVAPMEVINYLEQTPITHGEMNKRYPIYLSARQLGNWLTQILASLQEIPEFSVSEEQLQTFPPTLLIHARNDGDVPYAFSKKARQFILQSTLLTIESAEHDFDRQATEENLSYYQAVVNWMDAIE